MRQIVGRKSEIEILQTALQSKKPELIALYGRRRIGKTFLVRQVLDKHIKFELTGIYQVSLQDQLENFFQVLPGRKRGRQIPTSWIQAFHLLSTYLDTLTGRKKKVIFIDEFPWLDSRKSKFLPAFENFWNSYASKQNDLVVVISGSAASYMINKIIRAKGGLHNRLTYSMYLEPFDLHESALLLKRNGVTLTQYDLVQLYMVLGGVPFYIDKVKKGESVAQAVDRLCFQKHGFLRTEFSHVFASLFQQFDNHESIVRLLASVRKGLTRNEILSRGSIKSGGTLTKTLFELEESGFIENYTPYKGKKNSLYRLTDEYSLFYIKFIEGSKASKGGHWMKIQGKSSYKIWSGFTFETICIKHVDQIKEGLKISGIHSYHGSWVERGDKKGAQIDLLLDRDDQVISLCEMKFYNAQFNITKKYAQELREKKAIFAQSTKTKKNIFLTFITTYGLKQNQYSQELVQNELSLDCLFKEL